MSGVILDDETIGPPISTGVPFAKAFAHAGTIPGIKGDTGETDMAGQAAGQVTGGLDGLPHRLGDYHQMGASGPRWALALPVAQEPTPDTWTDDDANVSAAQEALQHRAHRDRSARPGPYNPEMEKA